ncbi:methyltransferase domain-containing protein [Bacillus pseudomycoides]|nr:methyltransferase domain-containing protein [Bacillus pseudomycoides]
MNAEQLQFPDESFDVVSLNLILSVVKKPKQALAEAIRVT